MEELVQEVGRTRVEGQSREVVLDQVGESLVAAEGPQIPGEGSFADLRILPAMEVALPVNLMVGRVKVGCWGLFERSVVVVRHFDSFHLAFFR